MILTVSLTKRSAHPALSDEALWDRCELTAMAGDKFKTNTPIGDKKTVSADPKDDEDPKVVSLPDDGLMQTKGPLSERAPRHRAARYDRSQDDRWKRERYE